MSSLRVVLLACVLGCGHAETPTPGAFTGTCKLSVPRDTSSYVYTFRTPDQMATHVRLRIVEGRLTTMHVETTDYRGATLSEEVHDDPVVVGDAHPNVPIDLETDVDVPVELVLRDARGQAQSPWDLPIRVRFHGARADAVVGRMRTTGDCVRDAPSE